MLISQLAERSGVPASTLRYYEDRGLLPAHRSAAGYRLYDDTALERLAFISVAKRLGLPLREVAEVLAVWQEGACSQVKASLRPRVAARMTRARDRIAELREFAATLGDVLARLDALPDRPGPCDADCALPDPAPHPRGGPAPPVVDLVGRDGPVVACSLDERAMGERVERWRRLVADARPTEVPGGLRVSLPAERAAEAAELAAAEQECCAFFAFTLSFEPGLVHLEVSAPEEAGSLVAELFGTVPSAAEPSAP